MKIKILPTVFLAILFVSGIVVAASNVITPTHPQKSGNSAKRSKGIYKPGNIAKLVNRYNAAADLLSAIQLPGTQPKEIGTLESPNQCDSCHGGYDRSVEPTHNWQGSMMANAGRDPLFWAALAVAEQDFNGSGDFCLRCHSTSGWLGGRSSPTDGSGLNATDSEGVDCDFCHKVTNPDNSEHIGTMNHPFIANDKKTSAKGYYGSGMVSMWNRAEKLGPYGNIVAKHASLPSRFHRSRDFCGTCHDVSNPVVGDLAHNNGRQETANPVTASSSPDSALSHKAAFNNFPYQYGVVERTFSEYKSGLFSNTLVSNYDHLPSDLKRGAVKVAYESAIIAGTRGNYEDGSERYFSCQTCHMRPVSGFGSNKKETPTRKDLPLHDMTGGNYWIADAIIYMDGLDQLRLGGGLSATQISALRDGQSRALRQLKGAASLVWKDENPETNTLKVINQTGHKLITGYPDGRRMWLNVKWYDQKNTLLREDGKYGALMVALNGTETTVDTILNLHDPNTKIYEANYGMTEEWAGQLIAMGYGAALPLGYDRISGEVSATLGDLASDSGKTYETFHFVLNNTIVKDNRIPPYGMNRKTARIRNVLPVPESQYLLDQNRFSHWDEILLNPPPNAQFATIDLLYQPTSWEYIQFLYLANNGQNDFLRNEGRYLLEAWQSTGMAAPHVMASLTWGQTVAP